MKQIYDADPRPPAWIPLAEAVEDPDIQAILAAGAGADPMPNIPEMNSVWQAWGDAMTLISNGTGEVVPTLDNAQKQITDAIAAGQ
jgi:maltose/maltodextrin transport system substrate-binding protein/arabinogalactan oligomer/maltooligosaccharide transport system substrate-binding protein